MSNNIAVYAAIAEVTKRIGKDGIAKNRKNQQQGYSFRGIDDVYNALSSHLSDVGLVILPRVNSRQSEWVKSASGKDLHYVTVEVAYDVVSALDGSRHTVQTFGEAMDSADKATNKAMSAAFKYMAMQLFTIPTEGDNDADAHSHEVVRKVQPAKPAKLEPVSDWIDVPVDAGEVAAKINGTPLGDVEPKAIAWLVNKWLPWATGEGAEHLTEPQKRTAEALKMRQSKI